MDFGGDELNELLLLVLRGGPLETLRPGMRARVILLWGLLRMAWLPENILFYDNSLVLRSAPPRARVSHDFFLRPNTEKKVV